MAQDMPAPASEPVPRPAAGGAGFDDGVRLSGLDIQRQTFGRRKLGGLDEEEVYRFLTRVAKEFEKLVLENRRAKEQVLRAQKQLQDYMELERTLKQTLQSAQRTTSEARSQAEREAALVLKKSELDAERIVEEARAEARQVMEEVRDLKRSRRQLRIELKGVLDQFAGLLEDTAERAPEPAAPRAPGA